MDAGRVLMLLPKAPPPVCTVTSSDVPMIPGGFPNLPVIPNVNRNLPVNPNVNPNLPVIPNVNPNLPVIPNVNQNLPDAPVVNESRIEFTTPKPVAVLHQEEITATITKKSSRKELLSLDHQIIIDDDQIDAVFNNVGIDFSQVKGTYYALILLMNLLLYIDRNVSIV